MGAARCLLRRLHRHCGRLYEDEEFRRVRHGHSQESAGRLPSALLDQRDADAGTIAGQIILHEHRADAFARLFEAVHEGVYIGLLGPQETKTLAANPHLKLIFGYAEDTGDADIRPFEPSRFVDPQARGAFIARLAAEGSVTDYLLRLR